MKKKDIVTRFVRFFKDRNYTRKGDMFYCIKNEFACCVMFQSSGDMFYCNYFVFPLFTDSDVLYFTYGNRLENFTNSKIKPLLMTQGEDVCLSWAQEVTHCLDQYILPFFDSVSSVEGMASFLEKEHDFVKLYLFCPPDMYHKLKAYVYLMLKKTDLCESNIQMAARLIENESYTPLIKEQKQEELRKLALLLQDTEHCNLTLSRIISHNKSKFFNL